MVEMERTEWSDLRQENPNKIEDPDIPDSDSTDAAVRLRNMANGSQRWKAYGNYRDENGAMGNGSEPVRTPEEWGNLGGSEIGTDNDGYEKEKAGVVWPRQKERRNREHQSSCRNEDGGEAP